MILHNFAKVKSHENFIKHFEEISDSIVESKFGDLFMQGCIHEFSFSNVSIFASFDS